MENPLIKSMESLCIWSENYRDLANWYKNVLGLKVESELNLPDDTGVTFNVDGFLFWIGYHDKVKGKNKDKYRFMPGFNVDSVQETYEILKDRGVEFIQKPRISPTNDYYVATALDPEDNVIQFFSDSP